MMSKSILITQVEIKLLSLDFDCACAEVYITSLHYFYVKKLVNHFSIYSMLTCPIYSMLTCPIYSMLKFPIYSMLTCPI